MLSASREQIIAWGLFKKLNRLTASSIPSFRAKPTPAIL
jgi:hypothetical protein